MHLIPFYIVDPELAARETRVLTLFSPRDSIRALSLWQREEV